MNLKRITILSFLICAVILISVSTKTHAQSTGSNATINDLKSKISDRSQRIADLEKEIAGYQKDLQNTSQQKASLQATVKALDLARKKLAKEVSLASNKIDVANENIISLKGNIETKEVKIKKLSDATANNIRLLNVNQGTTLIELALSENTLSSFLDKADSIVTFQKNIILTSEELAGEKQSLEVDKAQTEVQKKQLLGYKAELADKQKVIETTKAEQNSLLVVTRNKESNYQKLLADKIALKNSFEQDLNNFESQLKYQIDPSLLPKTRSSSLGWPLAKITITQFFGNTEFSKTHSVYNGKGHNGIDFAASIGTSVLSAADGIVVGSGNTDTVCKGASYGKWILIQHNNGLSTLYGHLSLVKAITGQTVQRGDVIAYSGSTGYVTGPHLHFTVYATQGVKIQSLRSRACAGTYTIPIASFEGYLNPIEYLPDVKP